MRNVINRRTAAVVAAVLGVALLAIAAFGLGSRNPQRAALQVAAPSSTVTVPDSPQTTRPKPHKPSRKTEPARKAVPDKRPHVVPQPLSVRVPAVGIESRLIRLGLNPDNTLEVPKDFAVAGWYTGRPVPGEIGPSIIAGHIDSKRGPAIFYRLPAVRPGAAVQVTRSDGTVANFKVTAIEEHRKDTFPTKRVYGPTHGAELRLITCGGEFDSSTGHYVNNIIVFAKLAGIS